MDKVRIDRRWLPLNALRAFEGVARYGLQAGDARFDAAMYSLLPADLARPWAP